MRRATLLLALALTPSLFAAGRLELFHAPQGQPETPVVGVFDLLTAPVSDFVAVRFRIRNVGDGPVTLNSLRVAGTGFSMTGQPSLPHIVAAGTNVDFTVRFSPPDFGSYSALLDVNGASYILRALGEAAVAVLHEGRTLVTGDTVDFGRMERGQVTRRDFLFRNTTAQPLAVTRATLQGPNFYFPGGMPTPWLEPGASVGFVIEFRASAAGIYRERLTIDRREFWVTGTVVDPPLPRPTLLIESGAIRSGEQGRVSVRLAEPSRVKAAGVLRMEMQGAADDAMRFVTGSRSVNFEVAEGDAVVRFGRETTLVFQAGTTAGTIVLTLEVGGFSDRGSVVVAPEAVRLEKASAARAAAGVEVRITGFDNTRTVSAMNFTFYSNSGQPLGGMPVRVPVTADFGRWWAESKLGGVFGFRAAFPISGDSAQVTGVDVEIVNASGAARTERLSF